MKDRSLVISASYAPSFITFRRNFIEKLLLHNIKVILVAPNVSKSIREDLEQLGCTVEQIDLDRNSFNIIADVRYFLQLLVLLRRYTPDLVISYTPKPNIYGSFAAKFQKIKSVSLVTGLGTNFVYNRTDWKTFIFKLMFKSALKWNSFIIFQNSDDINELLSQKFIIDRDKIGIVDGSGVDTHEFQYCDIPQKMHFVMICRFLRSKGVVEFLEAAKSVVNKNYNATFTLLGPDEAGPDAIDRKYIKNKYGNYVEILDEVKDVRPILRSASVFVLPSYREGTPRSVLEAMSMGRAIITTDVPGCRETVEHEMNGYLVKAKNVREIVCAMQTMCGCDLAVKAMGQMSRKIVEERYEINRVSMQYLTHIEPLFETG